MTATKKQLKRKRLKRGRDWHAWAWLQDLSQINDGFGYWAYNRKPKWKVYGIGKWVRVKFVEVPATKTGD